MDNTLINNNINEYLISRGWEKIDTNKKYYIFSPPETLNFGEGYFLHIYKRMETSDYEKNIIKILDTISQIYNEDVDDLYSIIIEDKQILSLHIFDKSLNKSYPALPFFNTVIQKTKGLLEDIVNYSVSKKPHFFNGEKDEVERYLNYCKFMKNESGSLITKIQLPNREEIKEKNIFETGIIASSINDKLIEVTDFINVEIIENDNYIPNDDFLIKNKDKISVNVSNKLKELYTGIDYHDIEFILKGNNFIKTSIARNLNKEKVNNLSTFSKIVREKIKEIIEDIVEGKIIELKSKNVDSDRNYIIVESIIKNVKSKISVNLNAEQIKTAADVFKGNKYVLLKGILEKEKTQYKMTELKEFSPL